MLTFGIIIGLERMCLPVLFKEISEDLNLSLVSIGTIWGMDPLAGIFVSLPGGLLADRFGVKRSLTVLCFTAGIFCALRGFSSNFSSLAATMFLFGLVVAMMPAITSKTTVDWFSGRNLALANAVLNISGYVGSMFATMLSATVLSPLLGGWNRVLFVLGIPAVMLGFLWWTTAREPDKKQLHSAARDGVPLKKALSNVIHIKEVWILGLMQLAFLGANMGFMGYLPLYLRNIGWTDTGADAAITVLNGSIMVGSIPMVLLSKRLKSLKGILFFSIVILSGSLALQPFVQDKSVFMLLAISGFLRSGAMALFNTMIFESKGVGSTYGGTAIGLSQVFGMLGAFAAPPIGNSLAGISPGMPFIFWAILVAVSLPLFLLIREKKNTPASNQLN
jgi:MFS family permease